MSLTSIGTQKTPGRPIEITFAGETGIPSANQELILIGHIAAGGSVGEYVKSDISNVADAVAGKTEAEAKFGVGSELSKMVVAAIKATEGLGTRPAIKCVGLKADDLGFGAADEALVAIQKVKGEYIVSCYDGEDATTRDKLKAHVSLVSGPHRVENNQFGSFGVVFNRDIEDPADLPNVDTQFIIGVYLRDTGTGEDAPSYSVGEMASASAARMAANVAPFNPLDSVSIPNVDAPALETDHISVGAGLESEMILSKGWTPLFVKANGEVGFVRTVTTRLSADGTGSPLVTAYYDVQDFNVLYFWRKTLYTRFAQPDFKQRKASDSTGREVLSEMIRLAKLFETEQMFQAVDKLAKKFQVERNTQDRHRFDYKTPVNVIPGLHVIAGNIEATTEYDTITL